LHEKPLCKCAKINSYTAGVLGLALVGEVYVKKTLKKRKKKKKKKKKKGDMTLKKRRDFLEKNRWKIEELWFFFWMFSEFLGEFFFGAKSGVLKMRLCFFVRFFCAVFCCSAFVFFVCFCCVFFLPLFMAHFSLIFACFSLIFRSFFAHFRLFCSCFPLIFR
jgi:hypothetical protein